tara:strand:+ start:1979 stop:2677 length:699 start_codon:yes stop_codon:yes gene_type:complete
MLTTCRSGNAAGVDKLLAMIETGRANRRESRKDEPAARAIPLRFAPPSPPSTIGTRILSALDDAGHRGTLTTSCRNYLSLLNEPQRHDADSITDQLCDHLKYESVQNVKRPRQGPKGRETIAEIVRQAIRDEAAANPQPVTPDALPDVSDVGTRIIAAIESAVGDEYKIHCGVCRTFLLALNKRIEPETAATIVAGIIGGIGLPNRIRKEVGGHHEQSVWLREIIERVINES